MAWMVLSLINPEPALCGYLARFLMEIPVNTFAGRLDSRHSVIVINKVRATVGKAAIIIARNNDIGFDVELVNHNGFAIKDFDGLLLISKVRKSNSPIGDFCGSEKPLGNG